MTIRLICVLLATVLMVGICSAATTTSGRLLDEATGLPVAWGWVAGIRTSTIQSLPAGATVWFELLAEVDGAGNYSLAVDDSDPTYNQFHVFSLSPVHLNEIHGDVQGSLAFPFKEDFLKPGVLILDGRQSHSNVDFSLESNRSNERVLMRDGVTELSTDIYLAGPNIPAPTVLVRTVYDKNNSGYESFKTLFGYNLVAQDSRGRFASDGVDPVFRDDGWGTHQDGYDTIDWIVTQPFSDGQVGMTGGSALAITQYMASGALHPTLKACYAVVGSGYPYDDLYFTGGVFRKHMIEGWLGGQGSLHFLDDLEAHPNRDAWHDLVDISTRISSIGVPFFHVAGWFDIFVEGGVRGFQDLQYGGAAGALGNQKLIIGPWTHGGLYGQVQGEMNFPVNATDPEGFNDELAFFDYWLKGIDNGYYDVPPVKYYLMGDVHDPGAPGNVWRFSDEWPPPATQTPYFLTLDGTLRTELPIKPYRRVSRPDFIGYTYDPANPVPTTGGNNLILASGPFDQRLIESRDDVIVFTSPVLTEPLEVVGNVSAVLYVSSDAPDTDFMVKLCDVYPDGRSMLMAEGAVHARHRVSDRTENLLQPGVVYDLEVDLWSTGVIFDVDHRIRVSVTSSNYPRWEPNPNTGEPFRQHTHQRIAQNRIHCSVAFPSRIMLPVASGGEPIARPESLPDGWASELNRFVKEPGCLTRYLLSRSKAKKRK